MMERRAAGRVRTRQRAQDRALGGEEPAGAFGHMHADQPSRRLPANALGGRTDHPISITHPGAPQIWVPPTIDSARPRSRQFGTVARLTTAPCDGQTNSAASRPGKLRVWSWWQRDSLSHKELACVIATNSRRDAQDARRRLELAGYAALSRQGPADPGFATAMEYPFQLIWMTLDDYVARSTRWLREEQLQALRTLAGSEAP
jgi:hypothetical protein